MLDTTARGFESHTHRQTFYGSTCSANCLWSLNLGLAPETGLIPTVILTLAPEESKVKNDVSQLPDRLPEVREAR